MELCDSSPDKDHFRAVIQKNPKSKRNRNRRRQRKGRNSYLTGQQHQGGAKRGFGGPSNSSESGLSPRRSNTPTNESDSSTNHRGNRPSFGRTSSCGYQPRVPPRFNKAHSGHTSYPREKERSSNRLHDDTSFHSSQNSCHGGNQSQGCNRNLSPPISEFTHLQVNEAQSELPPQQQSISRSSFSSSITQQSNLPQLGLKKKPAAPVSEQQLIHNPMQMGLNPVASGRGHPQRYPQPIKSIISVKAPAQKPCIVHRILVKNPKLAKEDEKRQNSAKKLVLCPDNKSSYSNVLQGAPSPNKQGVSPTEIPQIAGGGYNNPGMRPYPGVRYAYIPKGHSPPGVPSQVPGGMMRSQQQHQQSAPIIASKVPPPLTQRFVQLAQGSQSTTPPAHPSQQQPQSNIRSAKSIAPTEESKPKKKTESTFQDLVEFGRHFKLSELQDSGIADAKKDVVSMELRSKKMSDSTFQELVEYGREFKLCDSSPDKDHFSAVIQKNPKSKRNRNRRRQRKGRNSYQTGQQHQGEAKRGFGGPSNSSESGLSPRRSNTPTNKSNSTTNHRGNRPSFGRTSSCGYQPRVPPRFNKAHSGHTYYLRKKERSSNRLHDDTSFHSSQNSCHGGNQSQGCNRNLSPPISEFTHLQVNETQNELPPQQQPISRSSSSSSITQQSNSPQWSPPKKPAAPVSEQQHIHNPMQMGLNPVAQATKGPDNKSSYSNVLQGAPSPNKQGVSPTEIPQIAGGGYNNPGMRPYPGVRYAYIPKGHSPPGVPSQVPGGMMRPQQQHQQSAPIIAPNVPPPLTPRFVQLAQGSQPTTTPVHPSQQQPQSNIRSARSIAPTEESKPKKKTESTFQELVEFGRHFILSELQDSGIAEAKKDVVSIELRSKKMSDSTFQELVEYGREFRLSKQESTLDDPKTVTKSPSTCSNLFKNKDT